LISEAAHASKQTPVWMARQGNGHIVAMDGPGDPEVATGDVILYRRGRAKPDIGCALLAALSLLVGSLPTTSASAEWTRSFRVGNSPASALRITQ
jgi:hypothetical protein